MFTFDTKIRVIYAEIDKMGYAYYGNYPKYYEEARSEAMRSLGLSYNEMEAQGVMMPVLDINMRYIHPALYDDLLTVRSIVKEMPMAKMNFFYEIYNPAGTLIHTGNSLLGFMKADTHRACRCPENFKNLLEPYFK
ncbi:MAG: thioesterase family protein [Bacteroidales bacterium]